MNKTEVIHKIAETTSMTQKDVGKVVNSFLDIVGDSLKKGEKVHLVGFGVFETRSRAARTGKHPKTGETVKIKAYRGPAFKAGKRLKDKVK